VICGNLDRNVPTTPHPFGPAPEGVRTPARPARTHLVFGDLDPLLDRLAELLRACDRADTDRGGLVTTANVRHILGGPARVDRVLAEMAGQ